VIQDVARRVVADAIAGNDPNAAPVVEVAADGVRRSLAKRPGALTPNPKR